MALAVRARSLLAHEAYATHHLPLLSGSAGAAKKGEKRVRHFYGVDDFPVQKGRCTRFELASIQHTPPARRDMSARDRH